MAQQFASAAVAYTRCSQPAHIAYPPSAPAYLRTFLSQTSCLPSRIVPTWSAVLNLPLGARLEFRRDGRLLTQPKFPPFGAIKTWLSSGLVHQSIWASSSVWIAQSSVPSWPYIFFYIFLSVIKGCVTLWSLFSCAVWWSPLHQPVCWAEEAVECENLSGNSRWL